MIAETPKKHTNIQNSCCDLRLAWTPIYLLSGITVKLTRYLRPKCFPAEKILVKLLFQVIELGMLNTKKPNKQ